MELDKPETTSSCGANCNESFLFPSWFRCVGSWKEIIRGGSTTIVANWLLNSTTTSMTLYPKSTEWSVCLLNLQSWVGFGGINCGKPGDSCRSLFIPKRWRSPATFEFGSRELFIQTKVTSRIARIRILHQAMKTTYIYHENQPAM